MGLTEKRFRIFDLHYKKGEHSRPSSDAQPSLISDHNLPRGKQSWLRIPGKDVHLASVNEQTAEIFKTTNHVLSQLHEAQRLRKLKESFLNSSELNWVDSTIHDIEDAARDVAILLEPTRVDRETGNGRLSLGRQLRWVYRDNQRARDKCNRLLACHSSLIAVLTHLQRLATPVPTTVHELGTELPSKSAMCSSTSLHDSISGLSEFEENKRWTPRPSSLNHEMHDMLAWRRSKGAPVS